MMLLQRLTSQLIAHGRSSGAAHNLAVALLRKRGDMDRNSLVLTAKGQAREALGAAGRAKDRAAKAEGRSPAEFSYNPRTNRATLRHR
jgi:hypothetical protein